MTELITRLVLINARKPKAAKEDDLEEGTEEKETKYPADDDDTDLEIPGGGDDEWLEPKLKEDLGGEEENN